MSRSANVSLEDVFAELRQLRLELAAGREAQRLAKRRGRKRSASVLANAVGQIQPTEIHVAKAKRLIRRRLGL